MSLLDKVKAILVEMAQPTEKAKSKDYFHGTSSREAALGIAKNGIQPPDLTGKKGFMVPVKGKTYMTPHLHYAQIYALGGDVAGNNSWKPKHEYGYVFKIPGHQLKDVQPDEDSVGGLLTQYNETGKAGPDWLHNLARKHLGATTYSKAVDGEAAWQTRAGKTLLGKMSDSQKNELIDNYGAHVAHHVPVTPTDIYRIHTSKIPLLKPDGSNFFEHAEKINPEDI